MVFNKASCCVIFLFFSNLLLVKPAVAGEFSDWLAAAGSILARHEAGHAEAGQHLGFAMTGQMLSYSLQLRGRPDPAGYLGAAQKDGVFFLPAKSFTKYQAAENQWRKSEAIVAGAGFVAQQDAAESSGLPIFLQKKYLILNGIFKVGYIAYHFSQKGNSGDISRMSLAAPEGLIVAALIISGGDDLWRGSQISPAKTRIGLLADPLSGAVGLTFSGFF